MRDLPFSIDAVSGEAAAELVEEATASHGVEGGARHGVDALGKFGATDLAGSTASDLQKVVDLHRGWELGRAAKAAECIVVLLAERL